MKTREWERGEKGNPQLPPQSSLYFTSHRSPLSSERLEQATAMFVFQTNPVEDKFFSFVPINLHRCW